MMKKVFIDLGANKGQSINLALKTLLKGAEDYLIYSFEPNASLAGRLEKQYENEPRVLIFNYAIWNENTTKRFYLAEDPIASSLYVDKKTGKLDKNRFEEVQCIDFTEWVINTLNKEDYNILKFDIEGAEYVVLPSLIQTGVIEYFKEFHGEFHLKKIKDLDGSLHKGHSIIEEYFNKNKIKIHGWKAG